MKLDARTIVVVVLVNLLAAIVTAYMVRRSPALQRLLDS